MPSAVCWTSLFRTMICECLPVHQGNAAVQCDKVVTCLVEKGYIQDVFGNCSCPPGSGLNDNEDCILCPTGKAPWMMEQEGICITMIGFIIALLITALLALVAMAVAVLSWLMAYRHRPKIAGPLPHPYKFSNPLFTPPEPIAEPSPDYLS